jgi:hypothetical protein
MQLGGPGAAGQRLAVHPDQLRQPLAAHRIRGQPVERPGDGAGQGDRAVQRDIGLGQHAAHDEGQQMRRPLRPEGETDNAAAIGIGVAGAVFGVQHHPADRRAGAVMAFEPRRGVPAGVVGLRLHRLADPGTELGQPVAEARQQVGAAPGQAALQVAVGGEQVEAADGGRKRERSGLDPVHGGASQQRCPKIARGGGRPDDMSSGQPNEKGRDSRFRGKRVPLSPETIAPCAASCRIGSLSQ